MSEFQLHCFLQSGNAYKCALMLHLTGQDWQPVVVDFFHGETRGDAYRALNEMGEVPVLIHGDKRLTQSAVILDYLADHTGQFGATDADHGREILRWLFWDNHKLTAGIATYRFVTNFSKSPVDKGTIDFLRGRMLAALKVLNGRLETHDWVAGDAPTIADISICGYLFWPQEFGVTWTDYPAISAWLDRVRSLENWAPPEQLMPSAPIS